MIVGDCLLKRIFSLFIALSLLSQISVPVYAENVSKEHLEEVLLVQFHNQIVTGLKEHYKVSIPQFEKVKIASIKKDPTPETSEGMKPGVVYEVKITLDATNSSGEKEKIILTLVNEDPKGKFKIVSIQKGK